MLKIFNWISTYCRIGQLFIPIFHQHLESKIQGYKLFSLILMPFNLELTKSIKQINNII